MFTKLSLMGRGSYQEIFGTKKLMIDGLKQLIESLENEYSSIVRTAIDATTNNAAITYMGLQELYRIGTVVTTKSMPGLGGLKTSFKVIDCMYEPIRSLMGSLRYSFRMTLETLVYTGAHFLTIKFTEMIGEWKSVKDMKSLSYQPLRGRGRDGRHGDGKDRNGTDTSWIDERIQKFRSLNEDNDTEFSYMSYPAGSFFPTLGRRGGSSNSLGAASSSVMRVAPVKIFFFLPSFSRYYFILNDLFDILYLISPF